MKGEKWSGIPPAARNEVHFCLLSSLLPSLWVGWEEGDVPAQVGQIADRHDIFGNAFYAEVCDNNALAACWARIEKVT